MSTTIVILIVALVIVAALAVAAGFVAYRGQRSSRLRQDFGPEYDRKVNETGERREAESQLRDRERRHKKLELRPLSPETRQRYQDEWDKIQQRFVDTPGQAVEDADRLATRIMSDRGYPVDDFEQRAADVSVDHPRVVQHYREAHRIAVEHRNGKADTEHLRDAVTSYRALIDTLLEDAREEHESQAPAGRSVNDNSDQS